MKERLAIFCLMLITAFLLMGVVSAGENISSTPPQFLGAEETPIDVEIDTIGTDNDVSNDEVLSSPLKNDDVLTDSEGSFTDLQNIIDQSAAGSMVKLDKDYSFKDGDSKDGVVINKELIIDGQNHILDGKNQNVFIFHVNNSKLTLNNLKLINANCVVDAWGTNLTVDNCNFTDNNASISARSSYFQYSFESNVLVKNSNFLNSKYSDMWFYTTIVSGTNVSIYNSNFLNADYEAVSATNLKFVNSTVSNIHVNASNTLGAGSPVFCEAGEIIDSKFINNSIPSTRRPGYFMTNGGGAVTAVHYLNVTNSIFIGNSARNYGGAIYMRGGLNGLNVSNCIFINNFANESGGAIFSPTFDEGSLNIRDSYFMNNSARCYGGAIFSYDYLNIINSKFENNSANVGGAICTRNINEIDNSNFTSNKAYLGNNIAINTTGDLDEEQVFQFIYRLEDKNEALLSDGFTIFLDNYTETVYQDTYSSGETYSYIRTNEPYYYPYFVDNNWQTYLNGIYFYAKKSQINDYFLPDFEYYYELDLKDPKFGISEKQLEYYDLFSDMNNKIFDEDRWNEIKLNKVRELLDDPTISDVIPDTGYLKQINDKTYALIDFELLQSVRHWTYAFAKNGVGMYSYWLPAYRLTYKDISEIANFTVEKISLNPKVDIGETSSFDIVIKNTGLIDLTGIFVSEVIPEGLTYLSHSNSDEWIKNGDVFNYLKSLGVDETIKFTINFNTTKIGNWTNTIIAGSNETGNKTAENTTEVVNKTVNETIYPGDEPYNFTDTALGPPSYEVPTKEVTSKEVQAKTVQAKVDEKATGNPILLALMVVLIALNTLRRRRD